MPVLLLQKPSKSSKSKDHHALERRLNLWEEGKIEELLYEGQTIQERLKSSCGSMAIANVSMKFRILASKGNVNSALKLPTCQMEFCHLQTRHYS